MAIGDVSASGGIAAQPVSSNAGNMLAAGAANFDRSVQELSKSIFGYLGSETQIDKIYRDRAMRSTGLKLDTDFLAYQEQQARAYAERTREASASPVGMTSAYSKELEAADAKFLESVPDNFKEEYKNKLAQARTQRLGSMFRAELELMDTADSAALTQGLNTLGSNLRGRSITLEDAQAEWETLVEKSGLPSATKEELKRNGQATLQGLEFGSLVETSKRGYGVANSDMSGRDVVAAGLLPIERGVLNAISAGESPGYDVWNGGDRFKGYADHPAASQRAPGQSTAAGRYQFLLSTWRAATASYERATGVKVPDFSPEWQDRVALHWAEVQFNRRNKEGLTFRQVITSNDPATLAKLRSALGNPFDPKNPASVEWEGLGDRFMSDEKFLSVLLGQSGVAGGGTGAAGLPNVWTDARFSALGLDEKLRLGNAAWDATAAWQQRQAAELQQQRKAFNDALYADAYANGDLDGMGKFQSSPFWDAEAEKRYRQGVDDYRRKETSISSINEKIAAGEPLGKGDQDAFNRWFGEENFTGVARGESAAWQKLTYAADMARLLPSEAVPAIRTALDNPQTMALASEFLASLHAGDPTILRRSGFGAEDIAQAELYRRLAGRTSPDNAAEQLKQLRMRQSLPGFDLAKERSTAAKLFADSIGFSTVVELFDPSMFIAGPTVQRTSGTGIALESDAIAAFQDGYALFGEEEAATAYMESALKMSWGVTEIGGTRTLMKYPPDITFGLDVPDGGELINGMVQLFGEGISEVKVPENGFTLVADGTTELQVRGGQVPTYLVRGVSAEGEMFILPQRWGGEEALIQFKEAARAAQEAKVVQAKVRAADEAAEVAKRQLEEAKRTNRPDVADFEKKADEAAQRAATEKLEAAEREQLGPIDSFVYGLFQKLQRQITGNLAGEAMR